MDFQRNLIPRVWSFVEPSLGIGFIVAPLFLPLTRLIACVTLLLYFYLRSERLFNSPLVSLTPPSPDEDLPFRDDWAANGGLKKLPPLELSSCSHDECCICRDLPNDPMQITLCGHVFCADCISAWHAQGHRSCPQCTVNLWREPKPDGSQLENLVKFSVAIALVSVPLTVFTLYTCLVYYVFERTDRIGILGVLLLVAFVLLSVAVLVYETVGLLLIMQRRREQGVKWWGADINSEDELAWLLAAIGISFVAECWLAFISMMLETYVGAFADGLSLRILGLR